MAAIKVKGTVVNFASKDDSLGEITSNQADTLRLSPYVDCVISGSPKRAFRCTAENISQSAATAVYNVLQGAGFTLYSYLAVWAGTTYGEDGAAAMQWYAFLAEVGDSDDNTRYIFMTIAG